MATAVARRDVCEFLERHARRRNHARTQQSPRDAARVARASAVLASADRYMLRPVFLMLPVLPECPSPSLIRHFPRNYLFGSSSANASFEK